MDNGDVLRVNVLNLQTLDLAEPYSGQSGKKVSRIVSGISPDRPGRARVE